MHAAAKVTKSKVEKAMRARWTNARLSVNEHAPTPEEKQQIIANMGRPAAPAFQAKMKSRLRTYRYEVLTTLTTLETPHFSSSSIQAQADTLEELLDKINSR